MTTKKIRFANKTKAEVGESTEFSLDDWVSTGETEARDDAATIRFTIDIPTELHTRIKAQCATRRVKMKEVIQSLLEKEFPPASPV